MTAYVFGVDRIEVQNCKSKGQHNDDDWLHITVTVGEKTFPDQHFHINENIHVGQGFDGPWLTDPHVIDNDSPVLLSFVIENKSHTDKEKQESEVIAVGTAIVTGLLGFGATEAGTLFKAGTFNAAQIVPAAVGVITAAAGAVWSILVGDSNPDCNGEVLTKIIPYSRGDLASKGTHIIEDDAVVGPTRDNCGNPPVTKVTYAVFVWTLRTAMQTKGLPLGGGLRSFQPPIHSVRTFMGFQN